MEEFCPVLEQYLLQPRTDLGGGRVGLGVLFSVGMEVEAILGDFEPLFGVHIVLNKLNIRP